MKGIATIFTFLGALAVAAPVAADDLARWTFENDTISGSGQNSGPYSVDLGWPGIYGGQALGHHASASTAWSSPAGNGSIKSFSSTYWATGDYYQFQTSTIGYQNIAISWHQTSSSTGPTSFALRYSTDGSSFFDLLPGYTVGTAGWSSGSQNTGSIFGPVSGPPLLNNQPNVYFRLVSLVTPSNTAGTDRVDNIVITGVVSSQAYACCLPVNYRCITVPQATCQALNGTFYPGMSCGAPLPTEYSWVFNPDQTIINGAWNQNAQTVEDSTPIHRVTIDLQLTGTTGPLYITVEHLGWVVALWNGVCQSAVGMDVTFDDDGTIPACTGLTGGVSIKPSGFGGGSLSDFRGMEVGGPWILKIYRVSGTSLVLARWSVHVQFINDPDPCILIPTGACCKTDGTCAHLTQQDCMMQGGYQWQYAVPCSFAGCTPSGACCQPDGSCAITSQLGCLAPGVWHSHHASCTPNPCPQSTGACCLPNGHCTIETEMVCLQLGGAYYPGETCGTVLAAQYHYLFPIGMPMPPGMESQNEQDLEDSTPVGPVWIDLHLIGILGPLYITLEHLGTTVVLWNGVCQSSDGMDIVFDDDAVGGTINCTNLTGGSHIRPSDAGGGHLSDFWGIEFGGPWIIRVYVSGTEILILERWSIWVQFLDETFVCVPVPMGACCLPDGTCIHVSEADCTSQGGTEWHYAVPCSFANCPQPPTGACCKGGVCVPDLTFAQCTAQGGVWQGAGSDCFPNPCVPINYYWDATTAERGGDGYSGQWIYYPNAPDGPWYNMWWSNEYALNRLKDVTLTFTLTFPSGSGYLEAALVRSTPDWTNISRPPLADEEEYIVRDNLGIITTPGTYTFPAQLLYCPTWVSIDVRGYSYAVEGTIIHTCLAATTGACCVGWTCTIETPAACAAKLGRYLGNGTTCDGNPCAITDVVVCEPQGGGDPNNPNPAHPATYWYDVTPGGGFGRCDFHVRVYDPNPANYTNPSLPAATWQFQVHQVGSEWWASWWDPNCVNAIFGPNPTRFQFTHPNAAVWGDWVSSRAAKTSASSIASSIPKLPVSSRCVSRCRRLICALIRPTGSPPRQASQNCASPCSKNALRRGFMIWRMSRRSGGTQFGSSRCSR